MKNKIIALSVLIFIITGSVLYFYSESRGKNNPNQVSLEVSVEHSDYIVHQNVWITVKITNNSPSDYYLKKPFDIGTVQVDIVAPDNSKWINGMIVDFMASDSIRLRPDESKEIILSSLIYVPYKGKYVTGTHKITALYQGIKSNEVTFELKEPNKEEKTIYEALSAVIHPTSIEKNYPVENIKKTEAFIEKYPDSKYTPQAYSWLSSEYGLLYLHSKSNDDVNKYENTILKYLEKYSNELESFYVVGSYAQFLDTGLRLSSDQIKSKLLSMAGTHPGSKTQHIVDKILEENAHK